WTVDRPAQRLVCVEVWHGPSPRLAEFVAETRQRTFGPGVGLPGRVWSSGQPAWIADVTRGGNFPRAPVAVRSGLDGAFGFPIVLEHEVLGVIEFSSRHIRQPDEDLLAMLTAIGSQIGQFLERKQAEQALRQSEARKTAILRSSLDAIFT